VRSLAGVLEELAAILPGLKAALDRQADPRPEPLAYRKADAARMCGMSVRLWERLAAAGRAPRPDAEIGTRLDSTSRHVPADGRTVRPGRGCTSPGILIQGRDQLRARTERVADLKPSLLGVMRLPGF
jgi:hypothetical protein